MEKLQEKLAKVQVTELETRKEFTFYCCRPKCDPPIGTGGVGTA